MVVLSWLRHKWKREFSDTNLSLEKFYLLTFQLNVLVIIRAKVKTVHKRSTFIAHTALLWIRIIRGQGLVRVAPPFLPPHYCSPATQELQSSVPVEALFCRCDLDVQGLLHQ